MYVALCNPLGNFIIRMTGHSSSADSGRGLTLCAVTAYPDTQNRQESASEQQHSAAAAQQVIELAVNEVI
jgi:hypothetical protein